MTIGGAGTLKRDLLHAFRVFYRAPVASAAILLSIALGIGLNLAIFNVYNALLLKTLPVSRPGELVVVGRSTPSGVESEFPYPAFSILRESAQSLSGLTAWCPVTVVDQGGARPKRLRADLIAANYFEVLGVRLVLGAGLRSSEADARRVVVSHRYWTSELGGDRNVVGRRLRINNIPVEIAGVAPPDFVGAQIGVRSDFWLPLALAPEIGGSSLTSNNQWWVRMIARLGPGGQPGQSERELTRVFQAYRVQLKGTKLKPQELRDIEREPILLLSAARGVSRLRDTRSRLLFWISLIAAGMLLIVLSTVAGVLVGGLQRRRREFSIRIAIGATTGAITRQIVAEYTLLIVIATALGFLVSRGVSPFLPGLLFGSNMVLNVGWDWRVFAFGFGLVFLASLLLSIVFGRWVSTNDFDGVRRGTSPLQARSGYMRFGIHRALLFTQVAMSAVLIIQTTSLVGSLLNITRQELGFNKRNLFMFQVDPSQAGVSGAAFVSFERELLGALGALPGTQAVAYSRTMPLDSSQVVLDALKIDGAAGAANQIRAVDFQLVDENYFATMGLHLAVGEPFRSDLAPATAASNPVTAETPIPAIINETLARRSFGGASPVGRRLFISPTRVFQIKGVVADAKYHSMRESPRPVVYVQYLQWPFDPWGPMTIEWRTELPERDVARLATTTVTQINRQVSVLNFSTMENRIGQLLIPERSVVAATTGATWLGLLLVGIGVYGLISQIVVGRMTEFAVRMSLGARLGRVIWTCCRDMAAVIVLGAVVGFIASRAADRVTAALLYGSSPGQTTRALVCLGIVGVVALLGAATPITKLARANLASILRME